MAGDIVSSFLGQIRRPKLWKGSLQTPGQSDVLPLTMSWLWKLTSFKFGKSSFFIIYFYGPWPSLFKHAEGFAYTICGDYSCHLDYHDKIGAVQKQHQRGGETKIIWGNHLPIDSYFSEG